MTSVSSVNSFSQYPAPLAAGTKSQTQGSISAQSQTPALVAPAQKDDKSGKLTPKAKIILGAILAFYVLSGVLVYTVTKNRLAKKAVQKATKNSKEKIAQLKKQLAEKLKELKKNKPHLTQKDKSDWLNFFTEADFLGDLLEALVLNL